MRSLRLYIFGAIALLCASGTAVDAQSAVAELNGQFYKELSLQQHKVPRSRERFLKDFIQKHPGYLPAWKFLRDIYSRENNIDRGKSFFSAKSNLDQSRPHAQHMLALLTAISDKPSQALRLFQQSLAASANLSIIQDAALFFRNSGKSPSVELLPDNLKSGELKDKLDVCFEIHDESSKDELLEEFSRKKWGNAEDLLLASEAAYFSKRYRAGDSLVARVQVLAQTNKDLESKFRAFLLKARWQQESSTHQLAMLDSAENLAKQIHSLRLQQLVWGERGRLHYQMGAYPKAVRNLRRAVAAAEELQLYSQLLKWMNPLGQSLFYMESYQEALSTHDKAEKLASRLNRIETMLNCRINKGDLLAYFSRYHLAEQEFQSAYNMATRLNLQGIIHRARPRIADMLLENGRYSEARKRYRTHIDYLERSNKIEQLPYWLGRIAESYEAEGENLSASDVYEKAFQAAKKANSPYYMSYYLLRLGDIDIRNSQPENATSRYNQSLNIAQSVEDSSLTIDIFRSIGDMHMRNNKVSEAITAWRSGIAIYEKLRQKLVLEDLKIGFAAQGYGLHHQIANGFRKEYQRTKNPVFLDSLLAHIDLARSRTLKEWNPAQSYKAAISDPSGYAELQQRFSMQKRIWREAQIENRTSSNDFLLSARDSLISGRLRLDRLAAGSHPAPPTIAEMQTYLQKIQHSALLYHLADSTQFVLVLHPDSVQIVSLNFNVDSLRLSIRRLLEPFHFLQAENLLQTTYRVDDAHFLYQSLLQPIEAAIELPEDLLIVPDAAIQNLPFDLLNENRYSRSAYLPIHQPEYVSGLMIQKYRFSYLPDLQVPSYSVSSTTRDLLLVANPFDETVFIPEYSSRARLRAGGIFLPLPFTEVEAASIKKLYPKAQLIKRRQASDALIKDIAADYDILHFATHAYTDSLFEMFSGLVLSTGGDSLEDGLLMGYEIEQLQLNCELVTLSACETALGRQIDGEGVFGLPRLFLAAGARSVLQTHWKVDDVFTSRLMPDFYQRFLIDGLSKPVALAAAKREFLNQSASKAGQVYQQHPLFWASFNLFGYPQAPSSESSSPPLIWLLAIALFTGAGVVYFLRRNA